MAWYSDARLRLNLFLPSLSMSALDPDMNFGGLQDEPRGGATIDESESESDSTQAQIAHAQKQPSVLPLEPSGPLKELVLQSQVNAPAHSQLA